jgi:hypothetical protein
METWIMEEETLSDGSNVFNVVSYQNGSTVSMPCENWKKAIDLVAILNEEAKTVDVFCHHGE